MAETIFAAQVVSTLLMTGIIWFVQIVHYPLFGFVSGPTHARFAEEHQRRTGWVVGFPMIVELLSGIGLLHGSWRVTQIPLSNAWAGLLLLGVIWISTALIQVPLHRRLLLGLDVDAVHGLVRSNWIRTLAWSFRAALIGSWLLPR